MRLAWHNYTYYPYERVLARREVSALLKGAIQHESDDGLEVEHDGHCDPAARLAYFAQFATGSGPMQTLQAKLETTGHLSKSRQSTRYSVHGLHEYKGKFNPQIVRSLLNIFEVEPGQSMILDPFCGSGTTLVECAHLGVLGFGADFNPFAVFLSNAKLKALTTPVYVLRDMLSCLFKSLTMSLLWRKKLPNDARGLYLQTWFDAETLQVIETVREHIRDVCGSLAPIFLAIASNLLRGYSLQDPNDLRIRRRKSPLPDVPFVDAFLRASTQAITQIDATQSLLGYDLPVGGAILRNVNDLKKEDFSTLFDAALTSPPYAMALPYIDTQRLSLVWLSQVEPEQVLALESDLIGSREVRGAARKHMQTCMVQNEYNLPNDEAAYCNMLATKIGNDDGFRRRAVPVLLYRYFAAMQLSFGSIQELMRPNAPFALIVGHNHTVLDGVRFDINTPIHLANIARHVGWRIEEFIPLQTYHRYGYHMSNSVGAETLLLLRKP